MRRRGTATVVTFLVACTSAIATTTWSGIGQRRRFAGATGREADQGEPRSVQG